MSIRPVKRIVQSKPTIEGAGVKLRRAFGFGETAETDPFLLLDDFRNDRPADYLAGFPWHPHRGIETITYVLNGTVEHGDSLGNRGSLGAAMHVMGGEAYVQFKPDLIDAQGQVTDENVRKFLKSFIDQFAAFAGRFFSPAAQRAA